MTALAGEEAVEVAEVGGAVEEGMNDFISLLFNHHFYSKKRPPSDC